MNLWTWPVALAEERVIAVAHLAGTPQPKGRPRFYHTDSGKMRVVTPRETIAAERSLGWQLIYDTPRLALDETHTLGVRLLFCFNHWRKVDLDNLAKMVLDAMNGLVYKDDAQVQELHVCVTRDEPADSTSLLVYTLGSIPARILQARERRASRKNR